MRRKILLSLISIVAIVGGVAAFSAFEAHVINVTAHIENALSVSTKEIDFGTVFPQEYLEEDFIIQLSSSFLTENRVDDVEYIIKQKPKPIWPTRDFECEQKYTTIEEARAYCHNNPNDTVCCYLSLCPYLSKTDADPEDSNDRGVLSYFQGTSCQTPNPDQAYGLLVKSESDVSDKWVVDLKVPPIKGFVGQDWPEGCPVVDEEADYGCDLWIEVTGISPAKGITCEEKADVMLTLDRSGSIGDEDLDILKAAATSFVAVLNPTTNGVHMGQTSFSTNGTLDLHLTDNKIAIETAINDLITGGYTNLYEGILLSKTELDNPGDGDDRIDTESADYMVIITDGDPNRPLTGDPKQLAIDAANAAKNEGITIYVVGVDTTPEFANYLRNNIATSPSHYFDAGDWDDLQLILQDIADCD